MTGPRVYPGTTITLQTVFTIGGTPVNPSGITFKWKQGAFGESKSVTPTNTATGTYTASITPSRSGNLYYRWDTEDSVDYAEEGTISVARSRFKV